MILSFDKIDALVSQSGIFRDDQPRDDDHRSDLVKRLHTILTRDKDDRTPYEQSLVDTFVNEVSWELSDRSNPVPSF